MTPEEKVAKRRADMPKMYRGIYDRAMEGNSRKAGIKSFCLECMGWVRKEVELCTSPACPLYPYRPSYGADGSDNVDDIDVESTND